MVSEFRTATKLPDRGPAAHGWEIPRAIAWLIALALSGPAIAQVEVTPAAELASEAELAALPPEIPVRFRGETLFTVRAPISTLSAEDRARAIEQRLLEASVLPPGELASLRTENQLQTTDIRIGDLLIVSVQDADSRLTGRSRQQLAADHEVALRRALAREFSSRTVRGLALGALAALAATAVLALAVYLLLRTHALLTRTVPAFVRRRIGAIRFRQLEIVPAEQVEAACTSLLRGALWLGLILSAYFYLETTLGFFPWTRGLAQGLVALSRRAVRWFASGIWSYLPNLVYVALIALATSFFVRAARYVFREIERERLVFPGFYAEWAIPTFKIVRLLAVAFGAVVAFPYLPGSGSPAFRGVSVFLGVLLSLGSVSAVGNAVSGIVLTYMRPFHVGDRVRIADTVGDVLSKDLLTVRVRTIKNVEVTLPNSAVLGNHILNYSAVARTRGLILHTEVTISYSVPWRRIHELLLEAARGVEGLLETPEPFVLQTKLDDFYVHYELNVYTNRPNEMAQLYARLHESIQDGFHAAGVEIMSPHHTAARDGNRIEIPDENLPEGYRPPGFRISRLDPAGAK